MVLQAQRAYSLVEHTLGGALSSELSVQDLVNEAGRYWAGMHQWACLMRRPVYLSLRAPISFTGATWVDATKTLTKTAAFTNYVFSPDDRLNVTAGTATTLDEYVIDSRVSNDAITLQTSLGATASAISATLSFPYAVLPADFGGVVALYNVSTYTIISPVGIDLLMAARTALIQVDWPSLVYAISFAGPISTGGAQTARLELYPTPLAAQSKALLLQYLATWKPLTNDDEIVSIPDYCETLFLELVIAFARGREEEDVASLSARVAEIEAGPIAMAAKMADARSQPHRGQMRGGAAQRMDQGFWRPTITPFP